MAIQDAWGRWVSADGRWFWDGYSWRPTPGGPARAFNWRRAWIALFVLFVMLAFGVAGCTAVLLATGVPNTASVDTWVQARNRAEDQLQAAVSDLVDCETSQPGACDGQIGTVRTAVSGEQHVLDTVGTYPSCLKPDADADAGQLRVITAQLDEMQAAGSDPDRSEAAVNRLEGAVNKLQSLRNYYSCP